jgi:glucosamine-6-phosphate deaminase
MQEVYSLGFERFSKQKPWLFTKVADWPALNQRIADEVVAALKEAVKAGRQLLVICPVGPLDYSYWAELMNREQTDGSHLVTVNMDEFVNEGGELIEMSHPLSFRRYMKERLFGRLEGRARVPAENVHFPLPECPEQATALIERHGGADYCASGIGLSGHFAFNDPPAPTEPCNDGEVRNSRTRLVTLCPESLAQMCMGGTAGNWEIIPRKAMTLGMYELLLSKKIHLTFMRDWHAGILRQALFGPVTGRCPASFIQQHANVEVTVTELAARLPPVNVTLSIGQ